MSARTPPAPPSLVDAGSTWCKVFEPADGSVEIRRTKDVLAETRGAFDFGTGHAAKRRCVCFENDLLALARGALEVVDLADFTVLDVGSRDAKYVAFEGRRPSRLDWSVGCSTATGATVEMLARFYEIDFGRLSPTAAPSTVTCGVYALERVMDSVATGEPPAAGVARFVAGLAREQWRFAGQPGRVHLSGGFCANAAFVRYLGRYCEVVPLGRTVPLVGLWALAVEQGRAAAGPLPEALVPPGAA